MYRHLETLLIQFLSSEAHVMKGFFQWVYFLNLPICGTGYFVADKESTPEKLIFKTIATVQERYEN